LTDPATRVAGATSFVAMREGVRYPARAMGDADQGGIPHAV
jgi:hypothetical protein